MNKERIEQYLPHYIARLQAGNEQERYKWEALRNFQQTWDIDALDFKEMFSASLQAASTNLWESFNYLPKKMIEIYSGIDPEAVRSAFRSLFDEDRPVDERMTEFIEFCNGMVEKHRLIAPEGTKVERHYHGDGRAICLYLFFRFPERHYL